MKRIITGIKSTGRQAHIGNYFGMLKPFREHVTGNDAAIFVADLHSLTTVKNGDTLRENTLEIATELVAIFGDEPITIFKQSDVRQLPLLNWILNNVTPYSLMLRAHSFKDSQAKNSDINMGVFNYPILMAADILGYDVELVPVGKDQTQHLEFARDIAENFNREYSADVLVLPEARFGNVPVLPGLDGRKMSKSYDNFFSFFDEAESIKKKVMSIKTDSKGVEEPKNPDECAVFQFVELFGTPDEVADVRAKYLAGGYGYGHAKLALYEMIMRYSGPYRERRETLVAQPDHVLERLAEGSKIMNARMDEVVDRVRTATGI